MLTTRELFLRKIKKFPSQINLSLLMLLLFNFATNFFVYAEALSNEKLASENSNEKYYYVNNLLLTKNNNDFITNNLSNSNFDSNILIYNTPSLTFRSELLNVQDAESNIISHFKVLANNNLMLNFYSKTQSKLQYFTNTSDNNKKISMNYFYNTNNINNKVLNMYQEVVNNQSVKSSNESSYSITFNPSFTIERPEDILNTTNYNDDNSHILTLRKNNKITFYTRFSVEERYNYYPTVFTSQVRGNKSNYSPVQEITSKINANLKTYDIDSNMSNLVHTKISSNANSNPFSKILLEKFQMEAIYRVLPSIYGRLIYNYFSNLTLNKFENHENIQIEGVVETNKGIEIKAGFKNKLNKDKSISTSLQDDNRVWTEFIVKF